MPRSIPVQSPEPAIFETIRREDFTGPEKTSGIEESFPLPDIAVEIMEAGRYLGPLIPGAAALSASEPGKAGGVEAPPGVMFPPMPPFEPLPRPSLRDPVAPGTGSPAGGGGRGTRGGSPDFDCSGVNIPPRAFFINRWRNLFPFGGPEDHYGSDAITGVENGIDDRDIPGLPMTIRDRLTGIVDPTIETVERDAQYTWKFQLDPGRLLWFSISHIPRPGVPSGRGPDLRYWVSTTPGGSPMVNESGSEARTNRQILVSTASNTPALLERMYNTWIGLDYVKAEPRRTYYITLNVPSDTQREINIAINSSVFQE